MQLRHFGLGAEEISGADLHARGAQRKGRRDATSVCNASGCDHWHIHGVDDLRHESEGACLRGYVVGEKHAAMATGLSSLRNDRIAATISEPFGLPGRGRGRDDFRPRGLHPLQEAFLRQPEMKADDLGLELLDDLAGRLVERHAVGIRHLGIGIDAQLRVVMSKTRLPLCLPVRIGEGRLMRKEIEIDWFVSPLPDDAQPSADLLGCRERAG